MSDEKSGVSGGFVVFGIALLIFTIAACVELGLAGCVISAVLYLPYLVFAETPVLEFVVFIRAVAPWVIGAVFLFQAIVLFVWSSLLVGMFKFVLDLLASSSSGTSEV